MNAGRMLFHRDFLGYTGGHGKVWDYFNHALALGWDARVYLTPGSLRDALNPWLALPERIEAQWQPATADLLFLGGMDWLALDGLDPARLPPVLNLVQHVRHANPALPLRGFLSRPATRVCVSEAVASAISATGVVAGEVRVIPAAIDLSTFEPRGLQAHRGVMIGALKQPALGDAIATRLRELGCEVQLLHEWVPREAFLEAVSTAEVAVLLPHATEGFFLPGLEAMALGTALVMPGSLGSDAYAKDGVNCLTPAAELDAIVAAVIAMRDPMLRDALRAEAARTVPAFDLPAERSAFARVLQELPA